MRGAMLGEFAGTFMMMLLGDGVVAACLLKGTKATGEGWMVITSAWAFAAPTGPTAGFPSSGRCSAPRRPDRCSRRQGLERHRFISYLGETAA